MVMAEQALVQQAVVEQGLEMAMFGTRRNWSRQGQRCTWHHVHNIDQSKVLYRLGNNSKST